MTDCGYGTLEFSSSLLKLDEGFKWARQQALSYVPVSYTHLDVYKRQLLHRKHLVKYLWRKGGEKMATVRDIAEKTGYSKATISRVLSNDPTFNASSEARQKILLCAKELKYEYKGRGKVVLSLIHI